MLGSVQYKTANYNNVLFKWFRLITMFALFCCNFSLYATDNKIVVASDEWCPYICIGEPKGILVEVAEQIAKRDDIQFKLQIIPLSRALLLAQREQIDIVLAVTEEHISEFKLKRSNNTFGAWYNDFYAIHPTPFDLSTAEGLNQFFLSGNRLGLIKGYDYGPNISEVIALHPDYIHYATGESPLNKNIELLLLGRLDAILDSRFNIEYELAKIKESKVVRIATEGTLVPLYVGYRPNFDSALIQALDNTLTQLRKEGVIEAIVKKYGISDWQ